MSGLAGSEGERAGRGCEATLPARVPVIDQQHDRPTRRKRFDRSSAAAITLDRARGDRKGRDGEPPWRRGRAEARHVPVLRVAERDVAVAERL